MKIISLVPHPTIILNDNDETIYTIPPSGTVARASMKSLENEPILTDDVPPVSIPSADTKFGAVENVPDEKEGTIYIVSTIVASALPQRNDLFVPQDVVRDASGNIIGARKLGRVC